MMTLYEKIKTLYPAINDKDFPDVVRIQNDSDEKGDYIIFWNHSEFAKPTDEQLKSIA